MRCFLFFMILIPFFSCNIGNKHAMNVYFANSDSIYYCEGETFNAKNLHKSKLTDSLFIQKMLLTASQNDCEVSFKPMTTFDNDGGPVAEAIDEFCNTLKANGIDYRMTESDNTEKKYFDAVTISEYLKNR